MGTTVPVERVIVPAKLFRLDRAIVAVPVDPELNEIVVGLTVKPRSFMTTFKVTTPERVSGLLSESTVAYVPVTVARYVPAVAAERDRMTEHDKPPVTHGFDPVRVAVSPVVVEVVKVTESVAKPG